MPGSEKVAEVTVAFGLAKVTFSGPLNLPQVVISGWPERRHAHRLHRLAGDDLGADRRLDFHLELLARDLLAQALGENASGR